jgi:hypothetical protein
MDCIVAAMRAPSRAADTALFAVYNTRPTSNTPKRSASRIPMTMAVSRTTLPFSLRAKRRKIDLDIVDLRTG